MVLAGDADRERAVMSLREHFAGGRLTLEELSHRTELALHARSRAELRDALAGLPRFNAGPVVEAAVRGAVLVLLTGVWLVFSFLLLLALALTLVIHGPSVTLLVLLAVWLLPTFLLSRRWHRALPRRTSRA